MLNSRMMASIRRCSCRAIRSTPVCHDWEGASLRPCKPRANGIIVKEGEKRKTGMGGMGGLEPVRDLAKELNGVIDWSDLLHRYLLVTPKLMIVLNWNHLAPVERAERLPGAWDGTWFE